MKDTLLFELPNSKISYNENELLNEIYKQKENFIKRFGYTPKYINMPDEMNNWLFTKIMDIGKDYTYNPNTICGMKLISRFREPLYINDNEAICLEVK